MSQSSFAQSLLASTCVTGIIFSATALPFAALKSNVVNVEIQNQPIFTSELQYLAAPYLAVAGGVSAAVGVGVFGILGWRSSARKLSNTVATNADLSKSLDVHKAELERIKFSEARLRTQDLSQFLQADSTSWAASPAPRPTRVPKSNIEIVDAEPVIPMHRIAPPEPSPAKLAHAMKPAASGLSQVGKGFESRPSVAPVVAEQEPLESLLSQIQQLSRQVEELRSRSSTQMAA
ncbi:MAG: hypothetical protein ACHWZW_05240 [Spirulina sp.]